MLKVTAEQIETLESGYPGIKEQVQAFENASLPACALCGSSDTADVQIGVTGRTINISAATSKFKLIPNGPRPGRYFCNICGEYFNP